MQTDRHDGAVHLDLVEALPALPAIVGAVVAAIVAGGRYRERRVERVGLGASTKRVIRSGAADLQEYKEQQGEVRRATSVSSSIT